MIKNVEDSFYELEQYCIAEDFKGYDPYDGLNSTLFNSIPLVNKSRFIRLAWIQFFKRSFINFRSIIGVKKEYNPKALGLFLSGYCNLYKINPSHSILDKITFLKDEVLNLKSQGWNGACWGYNFDWQARAFFQPKFTPTIVVTSYVANALLDVYEITSNTELLDIARSSCSFLLKDLNRTYDKSGNFSFSYSPLDKTVVFNASLLGSALLSRVYKYTKEPELLDAAKKSVSFCCSYQNKDGSWIYGLQKHHGWIDNFHTGFNLENIAKFASTSGDNTFNENLELGYNYYVNKFFTEDGKAKYYNSAIYPIDIHAVAQLVVTLSKVKKFDANKDLADKVLSWTMSHMKSKSGYFYYQKNKYFSSKIAYMRWAQAWMFYALSEYLKQVKFKTVDQ